MIPRKAKRDAAEPEIVAALRKFGFSVERISEPGKPDLLCGFRGKTILVEVKSGSKGYARQLNKSQQIFADTWRGSPVVVLRSADEAIDFAARMAVETAA